MGSLPGAARLHGNVPVKAAVFREGLECPDAGGDHAEPAAHEHIPVAHAALLHRVGLNIADQNPVHQSLGGTDIFRAVDGKLRLVLVQKRAAVLGGNLEELIIGDRLPDAENVIAQSADGFRRRLQVVLRPVGGGISHAGLIEEVLVVDQNHVGKALGQAVLHALDVKGVERGLVQSADVHAADLSEQALVGVCGKVFNIQLIAVRRGAAGNAGLHLGEVIVVADGLHLNGDVGILLPEGVHHFLQRLLVSAGRVKVAVGDGDVLRLRSGDLCGSGRRRLVGLGGLAGSDGTACGKQHDSRQDTGEQRKKLGLFHWFCSS